MIRSYDLTIVECSLYIAVGLFATVLRLVTHFSKFLFCSINENNQNSCRSCQFSFTGRSSSLARTFLFVLLL